MKRDFDIGKLIDGFDPSAKPPRVEPLPDGAGCPRWSVMIPTFNCACYLRQTLESVLAQDPGPEAMQIEVIDDCSTKDDPEAVVREVGQGRVSFYRKEKNEGAIRNFNTCITRSRGNLVHILHGDDYVLPGFYAEVGATLDQFPDLSGCVTRSLTVREDGWIDSLSPCPEPQTRYPVVQSAPLLRENWIRTPAIVARRAFYENHGGFLNDLIHTADWEMWTRMTGSGGLGFINIPLAAYRFFPANDTGRLARSADNIRDYIRVGKVFSRRFREFDSRWFSDHVIESLHGQYLRFLRNNDVEGAAANRHLLGELAPGEVTCRQIQARFSMAMERLVRLVCRRKSLFHS